MHGTHWLAECSTCGAGCQARNAMAWAAQHNRRTGHEVAVEICYSHRFKGPQTEFPKPKRTTRSALQEEG